jgi:hypothetical protein
MEQTKTINGLTFLQFIDELKGKRILNHYGKEVPKFLLFWSGKSTQIIKENYNLIDRK